VAKLLRARLTVLVAALTATVAVGLSTAAAASAFSEAYGFYAVGNNGYVQSAGAHTFVFNFGAGKNSGRLACQLFNDINANEVGHGDGSCGVFYGGGEYVWARVYNESGVTEEIAGEAET
jgi:hypothetical protein